MKTWLGLVRFYGFASPGGLKPDGIRVNSARHSFPLEAAAAQHRALGFLPQVSTGCFDPPRNRRGREGLARGDYRTGCNRTWRLGAFRVNSFYEQKQEGEATMIIRPSGLGVG
jgi:hypothetical protein